MAKACGGKLHEYYMSLGKYDFMAVMEFPNDESATACSMAVAAGGHVSGMTTTKLSGTSDCVIEPLQRRDAEAYSCQT